jgi:uncharacterized Zn ribbon protein
MKTYNDRIATVGVIITVIAIIVSVITPEIRNFFLGNDTNIKEDQAVKPISIDTLNKTTQQAVTTLVKKEDSLAAVEKSQVTGKTQKEKKSTKINNINIKFENISYSGKAGNLDGKITFFNTNNDMMEFSGTLSIRSVSGTVKLEGNKLIIIESSNCKGSFTILENGNKIVGTPIATVPFDEPISVELYRD